MSFFLCRAENLRERFAREMPSYEREKSPLLNQEISEKSGRLGEKMRKVLCAPVEIP